MSKNKRHCNTILSFLKLDNKRIKWRGTKDKSKVHLNRQIASRHYDKAISIYIISEITKITVQMVKTKNRKQKQKYIYYIQKEAVEEVSFVSFWYKGV